ncbi:hypothetical protein [Peribacillus frigoritolerans]|uniref:hypothetical protein n=1 Tax=Peribacillus frigoritolerans TaxID=450367 RepID=UPI00207A19B0|nr:hypothetical protein [Peribacillus frigoritolerans]USK77125.1 hypothetical protein LIT31_11595 [Peribacillus frigoritolerans]
MFDIPDFSRIKMLKLSLHSLFLCILLSLASLIINDVFSIIADKRINLNLFFIPLIMVFGVLIAIKKPTYQK